MAHRKKPGLDPLGHSPFGKEHLEGFKKHHDDHGSQASNPAHGNEKAIPCDHWEMQYNPRVTKNTKVTGGSEFNAMRATERMTMYNKTNECDH